MGSPSLLPPDLVGTPTGGKYINVRSYSVDVEPALPRQGVEEPLVGPVEGGRDLADDLAQLAPGDGDPGHVAEEESDGGEGGVAEPLEVGDQGGQPRADQAAPGDGEGRGRLAGPFAPGAPVFGAGVLLDGQLRGLEIDLLDDLGEPAVEAERAATAGAGVQGVFKGLVDPPGGEQGALVPGMPRLAADMAPVLARRRRWGRLDDVRGGRLGGSGGVLPSGGELLRQTSHGGAQLLQLGALLLQLRPEPRASGTDVRRCFVHADVLLAACW